MNNVTDLSNPAHKVAASTRAEHLVTGREPIGELQGRELERETAGVTQRTRLKNPKPESSPARESGSKGSDWLLRGAFLLFLLALWQGAHWWMVVRTEIWLPSAFRSPAEVAMWLFRGFGLDYFTPGYAPPPNTEMPRNFLQAFWNAPYPPAIWLSTLRLGGSYLLALCLGFPLGLLVARYTLAEKTIGWLANSLQSLPSICWVPLAQLWMGRFGVAPIIFVTVLGALFAIVVSVADGLRNVPPLMARAGRTLGADGARLYFGVLLPAALPGIVSGMKIGWSFAWRSLMAAEIIVLYGGLGQLLQDDRANSDQEGVIATILIIIVLGLGVQAIVFAPIEKRLRSLWGLAGTR